MGLDASVRCRCFEDGFLLPGPVPAEDLFIDEEGYLSSKTLASAYEEYGYRQYSARFESLDRAFDEWLEHPCEHEFGEICTEWVANMAGKARFCSIIDDLGGEASYPLLAHILPSGNGGCFPPEKAQAALEEIDRLLEEIDSVSGWVLVDVETQKESWSSTNNACFTWMYGSACRVSMENNKIVFEHAELGVLKTSHFRQIPIGSPGLNGEQPMKIVCLEGGGESETHDSLGPEGLPKTERDFKIIEKSPLCEFEGGYHTANRIRRLLVASIQTENPIRWR